LVSQRRSRSRAVHVIDQQRDLGRLLGVEPRGPWIFPLPAWVGERSWGVAELAVLGLRRPWALNVGAGWPTKIWPLERQVEFARALGRRGTPLLVVWGSPAEQQVAQQVVAQSGHGILAPPTSIPQLAGLLAACAVVVSGDTGPLHLALALGTPAVGLFGPVPAERNGPRGPGYRTLQAPGAAWERRDLSKVEMGAISAAAVVEAAVAAVDDRVTAG
jgi:ADP-heptose:LPS heptosyltransferase